MDCNTPGSSVFHCLPKFAQIHVHWVGDAISPSHLLPSSSPFAFNLSQYFQYFPMSWLFPSGGRSTEASASASVFPMNIQGWSLLELSGLIFLVWSSWSPRDSQASSLAPLFESINSSVLSLLYGPTLTSIHDYWKNHSFNYMHLCQQIDVCFLIGCLGLSDLSVQGVSIF